MASQIRVRCVGVWDQRVVLVVVLDAVRLERVGEVGVGSSSDDGERATETVGTRARFCLRGEERVVGLLSSSGGRVTPSEEARVETILVTVA